MNMRLTGLILALFLCPTGLLAQVTLNSVTGYRSSTGCPSGQATCFLPYSNTNPLPISGSLAASTVGFNQTGVGTTLNATTTSTPSAVFTSSTEVIVTNTSTTTPVYCAPGNVTVTASNQYIPPGTWFPWYASGGLTQISCITPSGTATVNFTLGTGVPTAGPSAPSIGSTSNAGTINNSGNNQGSVAYNYGYNGTNWGQMLLDGSGNLNVNTNAGGINGFAPGVVWSGSNGVGQAAGEQHTGEVGGNLISIQSSALGVTAVSHAAGTCLGVTSTFSGAVRNSAALGSSGTSSLLQSLVLGFATTTPTNLDVILFSSNPGTNPCATDAATYNLAIADAGKVLGVAHLTDVTASSGADIMQVQNLALPFSLNASTTLYATVVVRGTTFTPSAGTTLVAEILRN